MSRNATDLESISKATSPANTGDKMSNGSEMSGDQTHANTLPFAGGPSKRELLKIVKKEFPEQKGYEQAVFILELKKIRTDAGLIRLEYYSGGRLETKGGFFMPLMKTPLGKEQTIWDKMKPGRSQFFALNVDTRSQSLFELAKGFAKRTFKDAKLQDFIPGAKKG